MSEAWSQWEGQVIDGRFELKRCLGTSGQSAVFLTEIRPRHLSSSQPAEGPAPEPIQLAIKLIAADPAYAARQLSRWRLAQILYHPNLLRIFDTGRCRLEGKELIFSVMEYADENLAQIIPERPLSIDETRQMLEPALEALAYLHGQGLVHGALTPAHIMATGDQIKLSSDWISPAKEAIADHPAAGGYDAPEVCSGTKSAASDVWSLGMVLSEALTQHVPVQDGSNQSGGDPRLPEEFPAPFVEIVRGCLRRDPELRWTVAGIMAWLHPETFSEPAAGADYHASNPTPGLPGTAGSEPATISGDQKANASVETIARQTSAAEPTKTSFTVKPARSPEKPATQKSKTASMSAAASPPESFAPANRNISAQTLRQPAAGIAVKASPASAPLDFLSWTVPLIRRFAVPAIVAIAALGALYAAFGVLHREPGTASPTDTPAAQSPQQAAPSKAAPHKPRPGSRSASEHTISAAFPNNGSGNKSLSGSGGSETDSRNRSTSSVLPVSAKASAGNTHELGVAQQVMPAASRSALATIQGTVRVSVKVKIDSSGSTTGIQLATPGPSAYFARLSQQAAQQWKFDPAQAGRSFLLHFEFRSSGIQAYATRAGG